MIKELIKLAADLDRLGFHREADFVDSRIHKLSAYIHGETGEETGTTVEESPLSEQQIFRFKGPKSMPMPELESKSTSKVDLDKPYFVLEQVPNLNPITLDEDEDEIVHKSESDEFVWKIHSSYNSREEAKMEANRLYYQAIMELEPEDQAKIDFVQKDQEYVLNGLRNNTVIK